MKIHAHSGHAQGSTAGLHARLQAQAKQAPLRPRELLACEAGVIGSVEASLLEPLRLPCLARGQVGLQAGWVLAGEPSGSLQALAGALRDAGWVRAWRNEMLAVRDASGRVVGQVERGVTRLLGIATEAVHLLGVSPDGRHWVQQRAMTKPDDPGLWDTMVGGMVPAGESLEQALERECLEEAGLTLGRLVGLRHAGWITTQRPTPGTPSGYTRERIAWYLAEVPAGLQPSNRDGEVAQFCLMTADEIHAQMFIDGFTLDASLMMLAAGVVTAP